MGKTFEKKGERVSVFERVTQRVIDLLEGGELPPWRKPWDPSKVPPGQPTVPHNGLSQHPYRGVNGLLTLAAMSMEGWHDPRFLTFLQAKKLGAHVRKGEQGTMVVYWKALDKTRSGKEDDETQPEELRGGPIDLDAAQEARGEEDRPHKVAHGRTLIPIVHVVFNVAQIEGLPQDFLNRYTPAEAAVDTWEQPDHAEVLRAYLAHLKHHHGADVRFGADKASYVLGTNMIRMPDPRQFESLAGFAGTLLHEATHFTSGPLNRDVSSLQSDPKKYAHEEIVAELGAWFQSVKLGLPFEEDQAASYMKDWKRLIQMLKDDHTLIFRASRQAQEATEFLLTPDLMMSVHAIRGIAHPDEAHDAPALEEVAGTLSSIRLSM